MTELHTTHYTPLVRYLTKLTGSRHSAEDLFQETMLRAWQHLSNVPPESESQRRWLFTVARRLAIDAARSRLARPPEVNLMEYAHSTGDDTTEMAIANEMLLHAFRQLSRDHQRVLVELFVKGATHDQAAATIGIPVGTVRSRVHYAMRALKATIDHPDRTVPSRRPTPSH